MEKYLLDVTICLFNVVNTSTSVMQVSVFFQNTVKGAEREKGRIVGVADFPISFVTHCRFIVVFNEDLKIIETWI